MDRSKTLEQKETLCPLQLPKGRPNCCSITVFVVACLLPYDLCQGEAYKDAIPMCPPAIFSALDCVWASPLNRRQVFMEKEKRSSASPEEARAHLARMPAVPYRWSRAAIVRVLAMTTDYSECLLDNQLSSPGIRSFGSFFFLLTKCLHGGAS